MADEREQQIRERHLTRRNAPKVIFTIPNPAPCWRCGKPATGFYNLVSSATASDMRPVCNEHNPLLPIGPMPDEDIAYLLDALAAAAGAGGHWAGSVGALQFRRRPARRYQPPPDADGDEQMTEWLVLAFRAVVVAVARFFLGDPDEDDDGQGGR